MPTHPQFTKPPVTEVVISADMEPINGWGIPFLGLYWARIRDEFPKYQVLPPAALEIERFDEKPPLPAAGISFELNAELNDARCWYFTKEGTDLIQVQNNRFIQNWRKVTGEEAYPGYERLRPAFQRRYKGFLSFLNDEALPAPKVLQVEMSYINEIEPGEGWESARDLDQLVAPWSGKFTEGFLPSPYGARLAASFEMPNNKGRLHVVILRAVRGRDGKEILQFRLVARVRPESSADDHVLAAIDVARDWIVRGFADWTTPKMHKIWGRI